MNVAKAEAVVRQLFVVEDEDEALTAYRARLRSQSREGVGESGKDSNLGPNGGYASDDSDFNDDSGLGRAAREILKKEVKKGENVPKSM